MKLEEFLKRTGAEYVQSRTNPKITAWSKLSEKKYRDASGCFLAEGIKLTEEALRCCEEQPETVLFSAAGIEKMDGLADRSGQLVRLAQEAGVAVRVLADPAFEKISTESAPQGVLAVVPYQKNLHRTETADLAVWQAGKRLLLLEEIRDPGNLGTMLRSAEAMGITGVILSRCADLYSPKVVRAAMGSLFRMPVYSTGNALSCVRTLREQGRRVLAAALGEHTLTLGQYETAESDCLIIGNEGHGVAPDVIAASTACVRIPMAGETESLNASAAAACLLWEYFRTRTEART